MPIAAPLPEALEEAMRGAIAQAPQLKADARWLWVDAYWPARRDRDRPTRVPVGRPATTDPDHVPGERLALGVGNDAARAAFTRSAMLVVDAHRLAGVAVAHLNGRRPPVGTRRRPVRGDEYGLMVDAAIRRLRWLLDHDAPHDIASWSDQLRRDAHAAAVALIEAHGALAKVLRDVDGTDIIPPERRCTNPNGCSEGRRPGGKECAGCNRYRLRWGKHRIPRRFAAEHAARDRRRERGEDYGENPLPDGAYRNGTWTAATTLPDPNPQTRRTA